VKFSVMCPNDASMPEHNLRGQIVQIELGSTDTVASIKDQLQVRGSMCRYVGTPWWPDLELDAPPPPFDALVGCSSSVPRQGPLNGMPGSKMQFKSWAGFLKDSNTLAACNVGPGDVIEMLTRTRGGRR
jgi:hypothetical protein